MTHTLSETDVANVLKYEQLIPAMEKALSAFSAGRVIQPVRNMLTIEEGKRFLGIMPNSAHIRGTLVPVEAVLGAGGGGR